MLCPKCNIHNNYYHSYCYNCGQILIGLNKFNHAQEQEQVNIILPNNINKRKRRNKIKPKRRFPWIFFIILLAVIVLNVYIFKDTLLSNLNIDEIMFIK